MILHIDMDAFFAAVEQRDRPGLRDKPVIVAGNTERSIVSTASYEARKYGIHSAMPVFMAKEKCSGLIIVYSDIAKYRDESRKIMNILSYFSPLVEQASIDEAYMDISGCERLLGSPETIALAIKERIYKELSLSASIGIAPMKFLSKIASDMEKPDGLFIIEKDEVAGFISSLPINKVPGVGKNAMKIMNTLNIKKLGDINNYSLQILSRKFGKMGLHLLNLANGIDPSFVETGHVRKSISSETTLAKDTADRDIIQKILLDRSQRVGKDLRAKNLLCRNVFIKLKYSDFTQITRSKALGVYVSSSAAIFNEAMKLFKKIELKRKIRLAGVGVTALKGSNMPVQLTFPGEPEEWEILEKQWESVDKAVDSIMDKFGNCVIKKASLTD